MQIRYGSIRFSILTWFLLYVAVFLFAFPVYLSAQETDRPNVIVLLADDLGWNGVQHFGSDLHETPNIDRLAQKNMTFTSAYAASPVCSPSRAALMTGQHPARLHVTNWIKGHNFKNTPLNAPNWTKKLERSHTTVAEKLKENGYATAHIGKWHLGPPPNYPEHQGFDVNVGGGRWGSPPGGYFLPNKLPLENADDGYLTDHLTKRAVELIQRWKDRPFFINFSYYLVHTPIQGKPELVEHYRKKIKKKRKKTDDLTHDNPKYAAMVHTLDRSVGRVLAALDQAEIQEETVVVFTSDNGGLSRKFDEPTGITDNDPLRRGKGSGYEGGIRVPLIVRWPGKTRGGSTDEPVITMDLTSTILDAAGVSSSSNEQLGVDGRSLRPLLGGSKDSFAERPLFWHYPHYHPGAIPEGPVTVTRKGPWKLLMFHEDPSFELFHIRNDLSESDNRYKSKLEKALSLQNLLNNWIKQVGVQLPHPNPTFNPTKDKPGKPW